MSEKRIYYLSEWRTQSRAYMFEFDDAKSRANRTKHGIDFVTAQALWLDPDILRIVARTEGEMRFIFIGRIDGKHWSAVITYRGKVIRLISVRRSRPQEVQVYEDTRVR